MASLATSAQVIIHPHFTEQCLRLILNESGRVGSL